MALDPSIIGQIQPFKLNTPFDSLNTVMEARQRQQSVQANEQILRDKQRAAEEQQAIQGVMQKHGGVFSDEALNEIRQIAPQKGEEIYGKVIENRGKMADQLAKQFDFEQKAEDDSLSLLEVAKQRPELYPQLRTILEQRIPKLQGMWPEPNDPDLQNKLSAFQQAGEKVTDQLKSNRDWVTAAAQGKLEGFDRTLASADDAEDWDAALKVGAAMGIPKAVLDGYGPYAPEKVQQLQMTPYQRAQIGNQDADNKRQAEGMKATVDYQNQSLALRRQALAKQGQSEPLVAVMGPDGKPVLVRRSQAEGQRPASFREQGRPVTSGDANRLSETNKAIKQADDLAAKIGTTGAGSALGAWVPNFVTESTGFGADSKGRQATIDLVKQIIGKTFEGGVLRAEDEKKYDKILPRIGDPPSVAKTKIENLKSTLHDWRTSHLEALEDAGYDTSKFLEREQGTTGTEGATGAVGPYTYKVKKP